MKAERLEEKIFAILSKELQLDMPRPVAAKRKVVNEIIALIASQPEQPREVEKYDYYKIREVDTDCIKGISCNLCESIDKVSFTECLNKSIDPKPDTSQVEWTEQVDYFKEVEDGPVPLTAFMNASPVR